MADRTEIPSAKHTFLWSRNAMETKLITICCPILKFSETKFGSIWWFKAFEFKVGIWLNKIREDNLSNFLNSVSKTFCINHIKQIVWCVIGRLLIRISEVQNCPVKNCMIGRRGRRPKGVKQRRVERGIGCRKDIGLDEGMKEWMDNVGEVRVVREIWD